MNRFKAWPALLFTLSFTLLLVQGCGGILTSDQPARQYYLLQPLEGYSASAGDAEVALQVGAIPGLDTDQLLALGTDARLVQYGNARWPDFLPEVLSSTLQRSLESTGRFAAVRHADRAAQDGWLLQLEARLAGYPPAFQDGYADGCDSARRAIGKTRDDDRFEKDAMYATGWRDGFDICSEKKYE